VSAASLPFQRSTARCRVRATSISPTMIGSLKRRLKAGEVTKGTIIPVARETPIMAGTKAPKEAGSMNWETDQKKGKRIAENSGG